MTVQIALLRAINVGGHGKVAMSALRDAVAGLGFADVRTLLQTGNLVFEGDRASRAALEKRLEAAFVERLGLKTDVMARTVDEWAEIIAGNPFPDEAKRDPGHLVVLALKAAPTRAALDSLRASIRGREVVQLAGDHAYITYPDGIGRSKLTHTLIESRLETRGTGRNWNTVLKLAALAGA